MKRILVVDDEEGIRQLYQEELEEEGYEVELAERGEEALEKISKAKPDAVILAEGPGADSRAGQGFAGDHLHCLWRI